jgi:hypothetical protein
LPNVSFDSRRDGRPDVGEWENGIDDWLNTSVGEERHDIASERAVVAIFWAEVARASPYR